MTADVSILLLLCFLVVERGWMEVGWGGFNLNALLKSLDCMQIPIDHAVPGASTACSLRSPSHRERVTLPAVGEVFSR